MSIIDEIQNKQAWLEYRAYKLQRGHLCRREDARLLEFIENEEYAPLARRMAEPGCVFAPPEKKLVNKLGSDKKRVVYSYGETESYILKLMAYLLYRYDAALPDNLYSFRRNFGAKRAIRRFAALKDIGGMYCYKADIHDYFNSIDTDILTSKLKLLLTDDAPLYSFLERLLTADEAVFEGATIREKRGAMAGAPISPFLANLYLVDIDRHFEAAGVPYARYSDDMILFAGTREELAAHREYILSSASELGLSMNPDKESISGPGEPWVFLGVQYSGGTVDLSAATKDKLKGKLSRQARSILRWKQRKGAPNEKAMQVFARAQARRFFDNPISSELTWARWFFPLLTTSTGLQELDEYLRQCMRYTACGRHAKSNYRITYAELKRLGLRSLVNEYYKYQESLREGDS